MKRASFSGLLLAALMAAPSPGASAQDKAELPIFDAHVHYNAAAWSRHPVPEIFELFDKAGVKWALVSSTSDEGTLKLYAVDPERIVPELRPYHRGAGSGNWTRSKDMMAYLEGRLGKAPYVGIGEFHLHSVGQADPAFLKRLAGLAIGNRLLLHVHSAAEAVRLLYELEPGLTILWAHAGMSEPAGVVLEMLSRYDTLHAEVSFRESDILGSDGITAGWKKVFERYPDRILIGSDTYQNFRWEEYPGLIESHREWLRLLPDDTARKIAYENAGRLFKRDLKP